MHLLQLPSEIRLQIYAELLVQDRPVGFFVESTRDGDLRHIRYRRQGLFPAVLRVSRAMSREALPVLYGENCFHLPDAYVPVALEEHIRNPAVELFIRQISPGNAALLRHVRIGFPTSLAPGILSAPPLHPAHRQAIEALRMACTGLRTLELWVSRSMLPLWHTGTAVTLLHAVDEAARFEAMPTLEAVVALYGWYGADDADAADVVTGLRRRGLPGPKWRVKIAEIGPRAWNLRRKR
jgi:hypothetical protein